MNTHYNSNCFFAQLCASEMINFEVLIQQTKTDRTRVESTLTETLILLQKSFLDSKKQEILSRKTFRCWIKYLT